jgi:hypothetical protein
MYLVFLCGLGIFPWAWIRRKISYSPWKDDSKWWSSSRLRSASSTWTSRKDHMLETWHSLGCNGCEKIFLSEASHNGVWGRFVILHRASAIKESILTWGRHDHHHSLAEIECARQTYGLDWFYILWVSWWFLRDQVIVLIITSSSKNRFCMKNVLCFLCWRFW